MAATPRGLYIYKIAKFARSLAEPFCLWGDALNRMREHHNAC